MEPTELRIGNYLADEFTGAVLRVEAVSRSEVHFEVLRDEKEPLPNGWQAQPITITEEILLGFGFSKHNGHTDSFVIHEGMRNEVVIKLLSDGFVFTYGKISIVGIRSLHQLQNLYFSLTKKELNIKL